MGEAKRRRAQPISAAINRDLVAKAVRQAVGAVSDFSGADCLLYSQVGVGLLAALGVRSQLVAGSAGWRVGDGDPDVILHAREVQAKNYVLTADKPAAIFHSWIIAGSALIDFSTCTLPFKAAQLDAADGGKTSVTWAPDYLWLDQPKAPWLLPDARSVAQAQKAGVCFYRRHADIEQRVFSRDLSDGAATVILAARLAYSALMRGENLQIVGTSHVQRTESERLIPLELRAGGG